jgi:hypothetical protein
MIFSNITRAVTRLKLWSPISGIVILCLVPSYTFWRHARNDLYFHEKVIKKDDWVLTSFQIDIELLILSAIGIILITLPFFRGILRTVGIRGIGRNEIAEPGGALNEGHRTPRSNS